MKLLFEEYGMFILEVLGGSLFLGIVGAFFFQSPMGEMLSLYITSVLGGGGI